MSAEETKFISNAFVEEVWNKKNVKEGNVPLFEFGGGQAADLTMDLFFDTYEKGEDVRNHTKKIWKLMEVPKDGVEPPQCQFMWGKAWYFKAVIRSLLSKNFKVWIWMA